MVMHGSDGWFCFERAGDITRPPYFQSQDLDDLFLEDPRIKIISMWCISSSDRRLIFFWGNRTSGYKNTSTAIMGRFGYYIRKFKAIFDDLALARGVLLKDEFFRASKTAPIRYIGTAAMTRDYLFEVYAGRDLLFLYQFEAASITDNTRFGIHAFLLERSERVYQHSRQAAIFFARIPNKILSIDLDHSKLFDQYFGPNSFDIFAEPDVPFAWPWQRSAEMVEGKAHPKQIPTVSLVMDVRNSTSALLLTKNPPKFAVFIDEIVQYAQECITTNGGYFDKETGDGISGHFDGSDETNEESPMILRALTAARCISTRTTQLCERYRRESLSLPLAGLDGAIGLFLGQTVWLNSWRGIRAIGDSVVKASRICGNAAPGEVGYCNSIHRYLLSGRVGSEIFPTTASRREIKVAEIKAEALPEAYFTRLS
jgi:class 3 adenylate cyclase